VFFGFIFQRSLCVISLVARFASKLINIQPGHWCHRENADNEALCRNAQPPQSPSALTSPQTDASNPIRPKGTPAAHDQASYSSHSTQIVATRTADQKHFDYCADENAMDSTIVLRDNPILSKNPT
jgi:hypothetical protein